MQQNLQNDIVCRKFGDPNKLPASGASTVQNQSNMLIEIIEDQKKFYEYSRIIWSSAQIMQHMIMSQMSLTKLNTKMLMVQFSQSPQSMTDMILQFLLPFNHMLQAKNIKVEVIEANLIPSWACTDWNLFSEILFHLVQNAIKFSLDYGSIKIMLSYHSFEQEFMRD